MVSRPKIVAFPTRRQADGNATIMENSEEYLREAIALAYANAEKGGRPFGAVIVRDGRIVAKAVNEISETGDPTSHAELNAIRLASQSLGADRSEEHTSELQSLMRISYAVLCLKKKNKDKKARIHY